MFDHIKWLSYDLLYVPPYYNRTTVETIIFLFIAGTIWNQNYIFCLVTLLDFSCLIRSQIMSVLWYLLRKCGINPRSFRNTMVRIFRIDVKISGIFKFKVK